MEHSKLLYKWIRMRFWNEYVLYREKESFETYVKNNCIPEIHNIEK
jgi:hypothetical protein